VIIEPGIVLLKSIDVSVGVLVFTVEFTGIRNLVSASFVIVHHLWLT
jgi:hypothetical protein